MQQMECVGAFKKNNEEYLAKLCGEMSLKPHFITWEDSRVFFNSPLILVLDQENKDILIEICEAREQKIIVAMNHRSDFKMVGELKNYFDKIFGFIDLSLEIDCNIPLVKNYLNLNFSSSAISLKKLAGDLDSIHEYTKSELLRVKDLHDRLVKVRKDLFKGVSVTSKFMAGEKGGGEFFDMLQSDHHFLYIEAGSESYILTSMIISELEILKLSSPTTSLKSQSENFVKMIKHHAKELNTSLNYSIINIDLKTLYAECEFLGEGCLFYQNEVLDFLPVLKLKLKPSEKISLLSSGAVRNLKELNSNLILKTFFKNNKEKNTKELINEFFFEVSKNKKGNFLNNDALMSVIEIDSKTLYQL